MANKPVSYEEGKARLLQAVREKDFQQQVIEIAHLYGWMTYHTFDSRRSEADFLDVVFLHPAPASLYSGFFIAEFKTEKGRLSAAQRTWLAA